MCTTCPLANCYVHVRVVLLQQKIDMRKFLLLLKKFKDMLGPAYWAEKIFIKSGLRDKAMNSPVKKFERSLTGWKYWTYQIVGGAIIFTVLEYLFNLAGITTVSYTHLTLPTILRV